MSGLNLGILFVLGVGVFGGILGARLFQRLRIPQVVGYIAIGLVFGQTGFGVISAEDIQTLQPFSLFALGIIGFMVGGELKLSEFKQYGRQFIAIMLGEGLGAFFLVGTLSGIVVYLVSSNAVIALASGIVFGAIASATDPAATLSVLWEYRCRGMLTTAIIAVVALDDALAMALYGIGTSLAQLLTAEHASILHSFKHIAIELGGAVILGVLMAVALNHLLRLIGEPEKALALAIGLLLLTISISACFKLDVILAAMTAGFLLANMAPRRSEELFKVMKNFSIPIYVLFFVLVGARLSIQNMPTWLWGIVAVYVIGRTVGKMAGAYIGAKVSGSPAVVEKYMGLGLFAQGGVAVGLSIMATEHLGHYMITDSLALGDMIIAGVTATTLIVQIVGPPTIKYAVSKAGEVDRNITEEDVIARLNVGDVMDELFVPLKNSDTIEAVIDFFSRENMIACPVIDADGNLAGAVSVEKLRTILPDRDAWRWLLVEDIMERVTDVVTEGDGLKEAMTIMKQLRIDQIPVIREPGSRKAVGLLDARHVRDAVVHELIKVGTAQ